MKVRPARAAASTPSRRAWARSTLGERGDGRVGRAAAAAGRRGGWRRGVRPRAPAAKPRAARRRPRSGRRPTPTGGIGHGGGLVDVADRGLRAVVLHLHDVRERGELAALPLHVLLQLQVLQVERAGLLLQRARRLEDVALGRRAARGRAPRRAAGDGRAPAPGRPTRTAAERTVPAGHVRRGELDGGGDAAGRARSRRCGARSRSGRAPSCARWWGRRGWTRSGSWWTSSRAGGATGVPARARAARRRDRARPARRAGRGRPPRTAARTVLPSRRAEGVPPQALRPDRPRAEAASACCGPSTGTRTSTSASSRRARGSCRGPSTRRSASRPKEKQRSCARSARQIRGRNPRRGAAPAPLRRVRARSPRCCPRAGRGASTSSRGGSTAIRATASPITTSTTSPSPGPGRRARARATRSCALRRGGGGGEGRGDLQPAPRRPRAGRRCARASPPTPPPGRRASRCARAPASASGRSARSPTTRGSGTSSPR